MKKDILPIAKLFEIIVNKYEIFREEYLKIGNALQNFHKNFDNESSIHNAISIFNKELNINISINIDFKNGSPIDQINNIVKQLYYEARDIYKKSIKHLLDIEFAFIKAIDFITESTYNDQDDIDIINDLCDTQTINEKTEELHYINKWKEYMKEFNKT